MVLLLVVHVVVRLILNIVGGGGDGDGNQV